MKNSELKVLSTASLLYIANVNSSSFLIQKLKYIFRTIQIASNIQEALEIYQLKQPDFIISDINFPKMNMVEFIKNIRRIDTKIQIALTYTYDDMEKILKVVEFDIAKIILNPLTDLDLEALLITFAKSYNKEKTYTLAPSWIFESNNYMIKGPSQSYYLTKREWLFLCMIFQKNKIITYDEMKNKLWENTRMKDNAIHSFIKNIRKKLPPKTLITVQGVGYRITSRVAIKS